MLRLTVLGEEGYNEETERFVYPDAFELEFEHSLVSLSKWESIHERPFLSPQKPTNEEMYDYIFCMLLDPRIDESVLDDLDETNLEAINAYINKPMTGTKVSDLTGKRSNGEIISAELIYYWMNAAGIDKEYENWHLNRLFTLLKVHDAKNQKPKKVSRQEMAQRNAELNRQRRKDLDSPG